MSLKIAAKDLPAPPLGGTNSESQPLLIPREKPPALCLPDSPSMTGRAISMESGSPTPTIALPGGSSRGLGLECVTPHMLPGDQRPSLFEKRLRRQAAALDQSPHRSPALVLESPKQAPALTLMTPGSRNEGQLSLEEEEGLTPSGPTPDQVKREVERLEIAEAHRFIARFDQSDQAQTITNILQTRYPGQRIQLVNIAEGVTDTKIVKVNGVARHVLKKVSLPNNVFTRYWGDVDSRLRIVGGDDLSEQVRNLFLNDPGHILSQQFSHISSAQREKIAYIFGANFGVPNTEVIEAQNGIFSLHDFVENQGSARSYNLARDENQALLNLQNLQDIGVLDILLENQDRNPGNILVVERDTTPWWARCLPCMHSTRLDLTPIDHALSYQQENMQQSLTFNEVKAPCWTNWRRADEALTVQTKQKIASLDADVMLQQARDQGLVVDPKIEASLPRNIALLQEAVRDNPGITLNQLYQAFKELY